MPVGSSDLSDALIESEENTLRLRTAQTRRTVNPGPLPDAVLSVTVVVVTAAADRFSGNEAVLFVTERQVDGDRFTLTRRPRSPSARFMLSRASKRGLSSLVTPSRPMLLPLSRGRAVYCHNPWHALPGKSAMETAKSRAESQGNGNHAHYHQSHRWTCQNWSPATRTRTISGMQE